MYSTVTSTTDANRTVKEMLIKHTHTVLSRGLIKYGEVMQNTCVGGSHIHHIHTYRQLESLLNPTCIYLDCGRKCLKPAFIQITSRGRLAGCKKSLIV